MDLRCRITAVHVEAASIRQLRRKDTMQSYHQSIEADHEQREHEDSSCTRAWNKLEGPTGQDARSKRV